MRMNAPLPLLALGLALPLAAQAPKAPAKKAAPKAPAKAEVKPASPVLARVGSAVITQADLEALLKSLPPQQQMQLQMMPNGREEMIKRMAESKLIAEKAKRMGLDKTEDFQILLHRTQDDLLARAYLQKVGEELQKKMGVSDEQVKAYFDAHPEKFMTPPHLRCPAHPGGQQARGRREGPHPRGGGGAGEGGAGGPGQGGDLRVPGGEVLR